VQAGKLGQVTSFTTVGDAAEHFVDQYMVFIATVRYGATLLCWAGYMLRLCHAFLVSTVHGGYNSKIN